MVAPQNIHFTSYVFWEMSVQFTHFYTKNTAELGLTALFKIQKQCATKLYLITINYLENGNRSSAGKTIPKEKQKKGKFKLNP